jgi:hypothetical protein
MPITNYQTREAWLEQSTKRRNEMTNNEKFYDIRLVQYWEGREPEVLKEWKLSAGFDAAHAISLVAEKEHVNHWYFENKQDRLVDRSTCKNYNRYYEASACQ